MEFNFDNNIPIYIQLVEQLKMYIISGKIKSGEKLLSVRELASISKVNPNTMQKALTELENMKLIYTERTNGKYITTDTKLLMKYKKIYAKELTEKYINDIKKLELTDEEIKECLIEFGGIK